MPHRILIVEDDAATRSAMAELLREERHEVVTACDGAAGMSAIETSQPDMVITDLAMPTVGGFAFIHVLRQMLPNVPVLIVSAHADKERRIECFRAGADDFLAKPVDVAELNVRVERHLERSRQQQEVARQSVSDALTGVLNRRGINNFYARLLATATEGAPISALLVDIDEFKSINDRYGHAVGDLALCVVSRTLQDAVRASDRVARFGGDEFVVVLPGMPATGLQMLLQRMQTERMPIELPLTDQDCLKIDCSIGAAEALPGETFDQLIARADAAMYARKRQRNTQPQEP